MYLTVFLIIICFISYVLFRLSENHRESVIKKFRDLNDINSRLLQNEIIKRVEILNRVDIFLKNSIFLTPIGTWKEEKVYKYIVNNNTIYEFFDFMTEADSKIGINDRELCFKQRCYKRIQKD